MIRWVLIMKMYYPDLEVKCWYASLLLKFLDDDSYANLKAAMESGNAPEAFRGAHTLKGVAQNLGFGPLYKAAAEVTESLRPSETSSGDMEKAAKLMPAVDEEYARTIAAIKEL